MVFIKVHVGFVNVRDGLQLIAAGTVRPALLLARRDVLERVLLTVSDGLFWSAVLFSACLLLNRRNATSCTLPE